MAQCNYCKKKLGCSCKKRTASNGTSCCASCIGGYEATLKKNSNSTGRIIKVTAKQIE